MRKVIIAGMLGNGLEWYDYALYAYTTLIFSHQFFPEGDASVHLLATLGIFAVGFIARPFGGVFFGMLGDRFGRRMALALSIFLMAIPTGLIGLLPTYAQIGLWAPGLLTLMRLLQGLSLGGAFSGSMTFLVEHAPPDKRGLLGSASVSSLVIGFLLGSVVAAIVKAPLSDLQYEAWGWRIPFLLGIPIGMIGLYIREHCEESPVYEAAKNDGHLSKTPVRDVLKFELKHVAQAIGIYVTVTMPFYLLSAYFITFTEHTLGRPKEEALIINSINMLILLVLSPVSAWLSDRFGRKRVLSLTASAFFLFTYPIFSLLLKDGFCFILIAQMLFAVLVALFIGPVPALLVEIFPTRLRYSGMALSYNIAAATFGGTAPMVCQWLVDRTGTAYSIVYYTMVCAVVSLVTLYFYRDRHLEALQ